MAFSEEDWFKFDCDSIIERVGDWFHVRRLREKKSHIPNNECRRVLRLWGAALVSESVVISPSLFDVFLEVAEGKKLDNNEIDSLLGCGGREQTWLERLQWSAMIPRFWGQETIILEAVKDSFSTELPLWLLRDMVRWPLSIARPGLDWHMLNSDVVSIALSCRERDEKNHLSPVRLGILADALEDAGCKDEVLLMTLRGLEPLSPTGRREVPFYPGTWPLDAVLMAIKQENGRDVLFK